jgi:hypothetical protein
MARFGSRMLGMCRPNGRLTCYMSLRPRFIPYSLLRMSRLMMRHSRNRRDGRGVFHRLMLAALLNSVWSSGGHWMRACMGCRPMLSCRIRRSSRRMLFVRTRMSRSSRLTGLGYRVRVGSGLTRATVLHRHRLRGCLRMRRRAYVPAASHPRSPAARRSACMTLCDQMRHDA